MEVMAQILGARSAQTPEKIIDPRFAHQWKRSKRSELRIKSYDVCAFPRILVLADSKEGRKVARTRGVCSAHFPFLTLPNSNRWASL